jgi:predicted small metal-binding protein
VVHADSEDELVRKAQEHMRKEHGKEVSREDVVKAATTGGH